MAVYLGADVINAIVNAVPQFVLDGITLGANLVSILRICNVIICYD